ncbi:GNAT family N-acetyltransferase [Peptoniphilus sp.]|jgi:RimJ/RimL family protein N-acetyltransferase|uniref:GNAT family N-acetyltransferase n=1 Tax=Peptoniphilus sp. TaxID=1971214 RepID=UPI003D939A33
MELRLARYQDRDLILKFYKDGSNKLKSEGIDQWQGKKVPNLDNFKDLINNKEIFVLEDAGDVVATCVIKKYDYDYDNNMHGSWITDGNFVAIHRVATGREFRKKGYGRTLLELCEDYAKENNIKSIRIDTHRDNRSMQSLIKKLGYNYCGIVYIGGTDERLAFEKVLED